MKLGCVIMAAGLGSRFGANKLLRDFCGKPLCQWALEAVPSEIFSEVVVVTGYEEVKTLAREVRVVWNDRPELGVSRTIRLGLEGVDWDGALFMTADQPLLSGQTLRRLAEAFQTDPGWIYAASHDGKRGSPVLFPNAYFADLRALEGDRGGVQILRANPEKVRLIEVSERELADCDTPELLRTLSTLYGQ